MKDDLLQILIEKGPIETIGVVGMGYVGIPSAVLFANNSSYSFVYGFQRVSQTGLKKIEMLNRAECPLKGEEPELPELLRKAISAKKFQCTDDFTKIRECDAITLAIQTPFRNPSDLIPDFTPLKAALRSVAKNLQKGTLVVLESTITPGSTIGFARAILEGESHLIAGEDFALAHAPERVMVGRLIQNLREHDRIVGGIDPISTRRACEFYSPILTRGNIIPMTATAAEVTKTAENAFRDLQIAAVNELALYCEAMGVNVYDVREGIASLKGEGVTRAILWPGAGVGGHCLTKDTYHLERGVRKGGNTLDHPETKDSLFTLARSINDFMPRHMWNLTRKALQRIGKIPSETKIAILGWAFIANSDDARNTPSRLYHYLAQEGGASVVIHDPYVDSDAGVIITKNLEHAIQGVDVIAIFTAHKEYKKLDPSWAQVLSGAIHPVIIDGRNVVNPDAYISRSYVYKGIGRGDKNNHPIISNGSAPV